MKRDNLPSATVYVLGEAVVRVDVGKHTLPGLSMTDAKYSVGGEPDFAKYVTVTYAVDAVNVVHVCARGDFADKLLRIRKSKGMTQAQLARALGVSRATVCKWETCDHDPGIKGLARIANALGVRVSDLMPDEPDEL